MRHEGFRDRAYLDSRGIPTIGYGNTRIMGRPVQMTDTVTPTEARIMLRASIYQAMIDAQDLFERFDEFNSVVQEILVELAFNLGRHRLSRFVRMRAAAEDLDTNSMAAEMIDSLWFHQVGKRSRTLVDAMISGEWKDEVA